MRDSNVVAGEGGDWGAQHVRRGHQRGRSVSKSLILSLPDWEPLVITILDVDLQVVGFPQRGLSTTPTMATTTMTSLFLRSLLTRVT